MVECGDKIFTGVCQEHDDHGSHPGHAQPETEFLDARVPAHPQTDVDKGQTDNYKRADEKAVGGYKPGRGIRQTGAVGPAAQHRTIVKTLKASILPRSQWDQPHPAMASTKPIPPLKYG